MTDLRIPLFPVDGTAASVTMTVWLGVCVVVFFNLRFGWTLSGLVVPGYLVPLLFVKPAAVLIIFGQAILTYLIVRFLSDGWGRLPWWSSFFGRDRFFVIILVSILVRAATDGWLLPIVGQRCNEAFGLQIDYRNDLHSYGLIVVSLAGQLLLEAALAAGPDHVRRHRRIDLRVGEVRRTEFYEFQPRQPPLPVRGRLDFIAVQSQGVCGGDYHGLCCVVAQPSLQLGLQWHSGSGAAWFALARTREDCHFVP